MIWIFERHLLLNDKLGERQKTFTTWLLPYNTSSKYAINFQATDVALIPNGHKAVHKPNSHTLHFKFLCKVDKTSRQMDNDLKEHCWCCTCYHCWSAAFLAIILSPLAVFKATAFCPITYGICRFLWCSFFSFFF